MARKKTETEKPIETGTEEKASKKKPFGSRNKGAAFERLVAKLFSAWCGEEIRRTPLSGGWTKKPDSDLRCDLICDNPQFIYSIEVKKREGWDLSDLITGVRAVGSTSLLGFWEQTLSQAPKDKIPLLVFSKNHDFIYVMFYRETVAARYTQDSILTTRSFPQLELNRFSTISQDSQTNLVICLLTDFLGFMRPPRGTKNRKTWVMEERFK